MEVNKGVLEIDFWVFYCDMDGGSLAPFGGVLNLHGNWQVVVVLAARAEYNALRLTRRMDR